MKADDVCQQECLTESCLYDNGKCDSQLCSPKCLASYIGNGNCDSACYVEACNWDGTDCDCSPGCFPSLLSNDVCDSACNTATCGWDNQKCVKFTQGNCASGCFERMLGDGVCNNSCQTEECQWDRGDCGCSSECSFSELVAGASNCFVPECSYNDSYGEMKAMLMSLTCASVVCEQDEYTETCYVDYYLDGNSFPVLMKCCATCCAAGYSAYPLNPLVCIKSPQQTFDFSPKRIYVSTVSFESNPDGSLEKPYSSLNSAFFSLYEKFTTILLLPGSHNIQFNGLVINRKNALNAESVFPTVYPKLKHLSITSYDCINSTVCWRAKLVFTESYTFFYTPGIEKLEISYVEITSFLPFTECYLDQCTRQISLFNVTSSHELRLTSVSIHDFSDSLLSLISIDHGSVLLKDVNITNIQLSTSVWRKALINTGTYANFTYIGGTVALLNSQLIRANSYSGGFLSAKVIDLHLENVSFVDNFVLSKYGMSSLASIDACFTCIIRSCRFENNLSGSVITHNGASSKRVLADYTFALRLVTGSVEISGCVFRNNTGRTGSAVYFNFTEHLQDINFRNCSFENELTTDYGVVVLAAFWNIFRSVATWKRIPVSSGTRKVDFPPVQIIISDLTFTNCSVAKYGVLVVSQFSEITVSRISFKSSGILKDARFSSALQNLYNVTFQCTSLLTFTGIGNLTLTDIRSSDCQCNVTMSVATDFLALQRIVINDSSGDSFSGSALTGSATNGTVIEDSVFTNNSNRNVLGMGIVFLQAHNITITGCTFSQSRLGIALSIAEHASIQLEKCMFGSNIDGAVSMHLAQRETNYVRVRSCTFHNNTASIGGALYFSNPYYLAVLFMEVVKSTFVNNTALFGSSLFSPENVDFVNGSGFMACEFRQNAATIDGTVLFSASSGRISITDSVFEGNSGTTGTAIRRRCLDSSSCELQLSNTLFLSNQGTSVIEAKETHASLELFFTNLNFTGNQGTCLNLERMRLTIANSVFAGNKADLGTAITMSSSNVSISNTAFTLNSARLAGGAIYQYNGGRLETVLCNFTHNTAVKGGGIFLKQDSSLIIDRGYFEENSAYEGYAIFVIFTAQKVRFFGSKFVRNFGKGPAVISLVNSAASIDNCSFLENKSEQESPGISVQGSSFSLITCSFEKQTGISGAFLMVFVSNVTIDETLFGEGTASSATAILISSSNVTIRNCLFRNLAAVLGGAIIAQGNSNLSLSSSRLINIVTTGIGKGCIECSDSSVSLQEVEFAQYHESAVWASNVHLSISKSTFRENDGAATGGGIACISCISVNIVDTVFRELTAETGSALYLYRSANSSWEVANCIFEENSATLIGTVYLEDVNIHISGNMFRNNTVSGRGAGLAILTNNMNTVVQIDSNSFIGNVASEEGGAIYWTKVQPAIALNNFFQGNIALNYGNDIASYAVRFALDKDSASPLVNLPSGQRSPSSVSFLLLDIYGAVVTSDNSSDAEMWPKQNTTSVVGVNRVKAEKGRFLFSDFIVIATPTSNTLLLVNTSAVANEVELSVSMRDCGLGEMQSNDQCIVCQTGMYSLDSQANCKNCPEEAFCYGNYTMTPRAGYWRTNNLTDRFYACPNKDACLGSPSSTELNTTGECAEGYEGNKCQVCSVGYFSWGNTHCSKCPSQGVQAGTRIVILMVVI